MKAEEISDAIYKYLMSQRFEIVQIENNGREVKYKTWKACENLGILLGEENDPRS